LIGVDREEFRQTWSRLHGGVAVTGAVGGWLRVSWALGVPLARWRVPPSAITLAALVAGVTACAPAAAGGRWPVLAALLVAGSGVLDGLDGTVAVLEDRASRWGYVLDSLGDRVAEAGFGAALWLGGAPGGAVTAWVGVGWLQEYLRSRAAVAGMAGIGVITVSERPTRIAVAAMFLLGAGLYPPTAAAWVTVGTVFGLVAALAGLGQLYRAVRRALRRGPDR
jgi:phosphatidylglycerophosphate synthase